MATESSTAHRYERTETATDREDDFFEIEVGGVGAKVFRPVKDGKRLPNYYVKGYIGGKQFFRGTGFSKKGMAAETARKLWKAALEGRTEALDESKLRKDKPVATIGQVLAAYEKEVAGFQLTIEPATVSANVNAFRRVLAHALGLAETPKAEAAAEGERVKVLRARIDEEKVNKLPGSVLTEATVEKFLAAYVGAAGTDRVARDAKIRGAVSTLRQARSVFSKPALKCFRGMTLPDVTGFMGASTPSVKAPPQMHLDEAMIKEMAASALELKEEQPALYLVHLLTRHLGMRNDEIENARMEWIERKPSAVWLPDGERREIAATMVIKTRTYWEPKQSEGEVPISPDVLAEIDALTKDREPGDYLIKAATPTDRVLVCNNAHSDFVRPWTEKFRKKGYELRRWAATLVAARQGEEMAERFLRHKAKSVAGKFYLTRHVPPAPITLADCGLDKDSNQE